MLISRRVELEADRHILLDFHCHINYESESSWARLKPFEQYRDKWLSTSQPEVFLSDLDKSMKDIRTIAEVWEDKGSIIAYAWVIFTDIRDYNLTIAEVMDIAVAPDYQRRGIGLEMLTHIEQLARERGANILRSGSGIENVASQGLHEKSGFTTYRMLYEKVLNSPDIHSDCWVKKVEPNEDCDS